MRVEILIFIVLVIIGFLPAHADDVEDVLIARLTARRDELLTELNACQKNTRGYKIAGITTIAATAGGVYGNIKLHEKIENTSGRGGGSGSGGIGVDNRTVEEKVNEMCANSDFSCEDLCDCSFDCPHCTCG